MKLAVIDLDGVVANVDARFANAEQAKKKYADQADYPVEPRELTDYYWRVVFDPAFVPLDVLIEGANEAILDIESMGWQVIFMTSRPESMRQSTLVWLLEHTVYGAQHELIMKASAFQYTKTTVWKAGMAQTLVGLHGASDVLIVDDEQANINEHMRYKSEASRLFYTSLQEAVGRLNGTWVTPDPFLPED